MPFISIVYCCLLIQEVQESKWDEDFKHNNAAAELYQKMEGEWEATYSIQGTIGNPPLPKTVLAVTDYAIKQKGREGYVFRCAAFNSVVNTFRLKRYEPKEAITFVTVQTDRLIIIRIDRDKTMHSYIFAKK